MDYDALAQKYGGTSAAAPPDYDKLAQQYGGTSAAAAPKPTGPSAADVALYSPTAGHGFLSNAVAAYGGALPNLIRGVGQRIGEAVGPTATAALGLPTQADVDEHRRLDAPLMATAGGKFGNFAGTVAPLLATAAIPAANTMLGAAAIGAGTGAIQPTGSNDSTKVLGMNVGSPVLANALAGAGLSAGGVGVGKVIGMGATAGINKLKDFAQEIKADPAHDLLSALNATTPEQQRAIADTLKNAPTLVSGASPTVAQALQQPEASILQRVVYDSPGASQLRDKIASQAVARNAALENVSPTAVGGVAQARQDLGATVADQMIPEYSRLKGQVSDMYNRVDPNDLTRLSLPLNDMQAAVNKYLGNGTFDQGSSAVNALREATRIGTQEGAPVTSTVLQPVEGRSYKWAPQEVTSPGPTEAAPVSWRDVQSLRSSIGQAAQKANLAGNNQEAAALNSMKGSIDETVNAAAAGKNPDSFMPPEVAAAWKEANASYANLQNRFQTGPQVGIFKTGADGQPAKQGGEIASAFWGNRPGLADDVQSFRRMIDDQPGLLGQFRSLITTHGAATADAGGNLTTKFSKWVDQTLPGLREAFPESDVQSLQRIAQDLDRSASANKLGTSLGGSNTYQNAANALSLGVLDSPVLGKAAGLIPGVRSLTEPALEGIRGFARNAKANRLANILSDSGNASEAINQYLNAPQSRNALLDLLDSNNASGALLGQVRRSTSQTLNQDQRQP